ncbi:hypothetical protein AYK25_06690 [Thermoplasmatales archaeon SM1-50]|nr:MAG: hypothetical protein AYK25_06690 [Thermoplasmatales archaeon SM1-50]
MSVVFAVCMALVMTSAVTTMGTSLTFGSEPKSIPTKLSYTIQFKEPVLQSIEINSVDYASISMPGCLSIGEHAGDPTMPIKPITMVLPPMKIVSQITVDGTPVTVTSQGMNLVEQPIMPYQSSAPFGSTQQPQFTINTEIYSSAAFYPAARYSEYSIGYSHGYAILNINLNPVQYSPAQGTLLYYPEMTVHVSLTSEPANQFFRNNVQDVEWVRNLVLNPEIADLYTSTTMPVFEYPGGLCDPSDQYDYVIVTTTQNGLDYWDIGGTLTYNWNSLMDKHNGEGLDCTLVTKQDILACPAYYNSTAMFNDSQARIREFCKDAFQDWGTEYVLIAGDSDTIPARQMKTAYESNIDADIYWSNLDNNFNADGDNYWGEEADNGFDLYAELCIGRITCDVPQDVSNWLTKSFYYADNMEGEYLDNAAFYGGNTGWQCQGDDFIDYSALKGTNDWLGPDPHHDGLFPAWAGFQYGFETWNIVNPGNMYNLSVKWTAEPTNPGWQGGSESAAITGLRNAINNDQVTLIAGIAHANPSMSLDVNMGTWESQYTNTKPFFIHDYGCHCGDFSAQDDGIIETMLFVSNTKLAFGCVYNTCYGWGNLYCTNSSSAFQQKEFWHYFFDMENNSNDFGNWQFSKAQKWSKDRMAPTINWDYSYGTWRAIIQGCLLFGDPAQLLKSPNPSLPPEQPARPNGPTLGIWHQEYNYVSSTNEPDNEQIFYLFDWDDGSNSGWLGPYTSGQTVTASHTWTVLGAYEIRVRARDIWGASSDWSEALNVTITDNTPPEIPEITGTIEGKPGNEYLYNLLTTDPQDQEIYYFVDWGDNTTSGWLGPYVSGTQIHVTHSWTSQGTYTVKAKAKDSLDMESDWGTLTVVMPMNYKFPLQVFLQQLLEQFPRMFPILRYLMGY